MAPSALIPAGSLRIKLAKKKHPPRNRSLSEELGRILSRGAKSWNEWRRSNPETYIDLRDLDFFTKHGVGFILAGVNLSGANLSNTNLARVDLRGADLSAVYAEDGDFQGAMLQAADLKGSYFSSCRFALAHLDQADLRLSHFTDCDFLMVELRGANLRKADFSSSNIINGCFENAILSEIDLSDAVLRGSDLSNAVLDKAMLEGASLVNTNLRGARIDGARVFGTSVWNCDLSETGQVNLVITPDGEPEITVDNLKVAQFIYLILNNHEVRDVIDTITSKVVLILGRFTAEKKPVLDAIREKVRHLNYMPVMFDFDRPSSKNYIETVKTLAGMARFVIADVTDANVVLQEIDNIVKEFPSTPVKPIILKGTAVNAVLQDFMDYSTFLDIYVYESVTDLIESLEGNVIAPAEAKVVEIRARRNAAALALSKIRPGE
jgi:uncharacterized protein YjbI with pentapeptide repeats